MNKYGIIESTMISGIYQIQNVLNGKCYIGSAVDLRRRWMVHLNTLRRGRHHNFHLQSAFDKYGETTFIFEILEEAKSETLIEREQYFLDALLPEYNLSPTAGSSLGVQCTEETKQKIGVANTGKRSPMYGKHHSAAAKQKLREARTGKRSPMYGKHHSEETKQKISAAKTGKRTGEQSPNYGKHLSEETKQKISKAETGKHISVETKQKMSKARIGKRNPMYGKHHSEETKKKISEAKTGKQTGERNPNYKKHLHEKTKLKMSNAQKICGCKKHKLNIIKEEFS